MKKRTKIITAVVVIGVIAAVVLPRVLKPKEAADVVPPPNVMVETPGIGTIELFRSMTGKVEPSDIVYVTPKLAGEVTEVYIKTGDQVTAGQPILKIDNKQIQSTKISVDSAALSLADANTNLARMQVLFQSGDISAQALEQAQTAVKSAKLQLQTAKLSYDTQVEYTTLTAPISGSVESFDVEVHDMISQQASVCVISGGETKMVTFSVPDKIVKNIAVGDAIRIEKSGSEYEGNITEISSMIDADTGLFKIKASLNDGEALATGASVKLYVRSDIAVNAMTLPVDTVYYEGGNGFVYTFDNNVVHKVPVETGIYDSEKIQILSGLTESDQIITTWSPELYEGAPATLDTENAQ